MDLHRLVRQIGRDFPEIADPGVIAEKVFAAMDPRDYPDAVRTMLRSYVRVVLKEGRSVQVPAVPADLEPPELEDGARLPSQAPRPSRKVAAIRETWRAHLADRIHTGGGAWKLLRDCSAVDLKTAAEERRRLAAENTASAQRYGELATALEESGAATVADLADAVLEPLLS